MSLEYTLTLTIETQTGPGPANVISESISHTALEKEMAKFDLLCLDYDTIEQRIMSRIAEAQGDTNATRKDQS